jgi:hypothetical protein
MLILGVIGFIAVISVAAYFVMSKKEGIKDGNYVIKEGDGRNKAYIIVSKDSVELGNYVDNLPNKKMDFNLIKSGTTFKFDNKELPLFEASIPIDSRPTYFAQSSDDSIFILTKDNSGSLIVAPVKLVPTNRI